MWAAALMHSSWGIFKLKLFVLLLPFIFAVESQAHDLCVLDMSKPADSNLRQVCSTDSGTGVVWGRFFSGADRQPCLRVISQYLNSANGNSAMDNLADSLPTEEAPVINLVVGGTRGNYEALSLRITAGERVFNFPASACDVNAAVANVTSQVRMGAPTLVPRDRGGLNTSRIPTSEGHN